MNTGGSDQSKSEGKQSTVTGKIQVGVQPAGIAGTQDRSTTVVANLGSDTVSVIENRAVAGTIRLPPLTRPYGIVLVKMERAPTSPVLYGQEARCWYWM